MSRSEEIIEIVSRERKVEVVDLAQRLGVSSVTIRKDLDKLEEKGILSRQHGFAMLDNTDDINLRLALHYDLKLKIAQAAAEIVDDGETVLIESGSTCAILAEILSSTKKNLTLITNSLFIANYVRKSEAKVIVIGGSYQKNSQVNVGPLVKKIIDEFYVDKLFIGIDGLDKTRGFMCSDLDRSDTTRMLASAAKKTIILTDSSKFGKSSTVNEFEFSEISEIYTDSGIKKEQKDFLKKQGIKLNIIK